MQKESIVDSFQDALKPGNIVSKILQFFFFGVVTATPYIVRNLDQVAFKVQESGAVGAAVLLAYFKALLAAMWTGVGIGLSTLFSTLINFADLWQAKAYGTIIFSIIVLVFATLMIYQPLRLLFNILDLQKGRKHSAMLVGLVSLAVTLVVAAPIAYYTVGDTITSGLDDQISTVVDYKNETNQTQNISIKNTIDMLTGG